MLSQATCPCGVSSVYALCCGRFIDGQQSAQTPEELMRSRYTAYAHSMIDYIAKTVRGKARHDFCAQSAKQWSQSVVWDSLTVLEISPVDVFSTRGTVTFEARYIDKGSLCVMYEKSQFEMIDGVWFYVSAETSSIRVESSFSI